MTKLCIGVAFGGKSSEYEVSLQSAKNIIHTINKSVFEIVLLGIDKQGIWHMYDTNNHSIYANNITYSNLTSSKTEIAIIPGYKTGQLIDAKNAQVLTQVDVIFPVIHGKYGEDGSLQGMLRMINLPFVGADVLGSASCMDKDISKRLLRDAGLNVAPFVTITKKNFIKHSFSDLSMQLGLPLFIKPTNQGSSIGITKVSNEVQFIDAAQLAFRFDHKIIIESCIEGREIECAILGNDVLQVSTCGEIISKDNFYSYDKKYINQHDTQVIVPAILDPWIYNMIQEAAILAYQTLNCQVTARIDFFLTSNNKIIINEINTMPGFTDNSMYPKLWQASGLSYSTLISKLINLSLERERSYHTMINSLYEYIVIIYVCLLLCIY